MSLPSTFLHGYATASYQIEGAHDKDGKGPSIWDEFVLREGKINRGETGAIADDSYHMYKEDVALLKEFGSNAYRFSIAWSRVIPLGGRDDPVNEAGIAYYNALIDECLANGITPMATLYHWDLPAGLEHRYGGWLNTAESSADFERYAALCFERFGDRVKHWITLNEPWCACAWGYATAWMAPGRSSNDPTGDTKTEPYRVGHSLLIAHAKAVKVYRDKFKPTQKGEIGITLNCDWGEAYDDSAKAKENVQRYMDALLGWFAEPIYGTGDYPVSFKKLLGDRLPTFTKEERELVYGSSDFFGLNSYTTNLIKGEEDEAEWFGGVGKTQVRADGSLLGRQGEAPWLQDYPSGFRSLLRYINKNFIKDTGLVIMITEQGYPVHREYKLSLPEIINDTDRQDYFAGYLKEVLEAVTEDNIKIGSYIAWTLTDNFEWAAGFDQRFGSAYVDHENGNKRIPKDSGKWLGAWFAKNVAK